jgi:hypothetical protein
MTIPFADTLAAPVAHDVPFHEPITTPEEESKDEYLSKSALDEKYDDGSVEVTTPEGLRYDDESSVNADEKIIVTGADAATYLLPMRDDGDPALTFRSMFLATGLAAFQAVMYQIYSVSLAFILLVIDADMC